MARIAPLVLLALASCDPGSSELADDRDDGFPTGKADGGLDEGSPEALGVLRVANTTDFETLDRSASEGGVGLIVTAATNIVALRVGPDGLEGTDDDGFSSLADLDAVPWVGPVALAQMLAYAEEARFIEPPTPWWARSMRMPGSLGNASEGAYVRDTCLVLPGAGESYTHRVLIPAPGTYDVFVNAYRDAAGPLPAQMLVSLDGEPLAEFDVTAQGGDWDVHHVQAEIAAADGEPRSLEVSFVGAGGDPDDPSALVLCGIGIDTLGIVTYPGVPLGPVRGFIDLDVPTRAYDTSRHNWVTVGSGEVPTRCVAKGHNPGRILWDCSFEAYAMHSRFARYSIPDILKRFRGFAPQPYASTGASRTSGVMLETTAADPGYVELTMAPLDDEAAVNLEYELYLPGDYVLRGLLLDAQVTWE